MPRHLPAILLALGLFALALCARLPRLDRESLWEDDWLALDRASMVPAEMARIQQWLGPSRTTYDFHPPLYYALEHTILGFDRSVYAVKFSGALAGAPHRLRRRHRARTDLRRGVSVGCDRPQAHARRG